MGIDRPREFIEIAALQLALLSILHFHLPLPNEVCAAAVPTDAAARVPLLHKGWRRCGNFILLPRYHSVIQPVVRQTLVALDARIPQ